MPGARGSARLSLTGVEEINANIRVYFRRTNETYRRLIRTTSKTIQRIARENASSDTGDLREGIVINNNGLSATVISSSPHSQAVEFGTRPHPRSNRPGVARKAPPLDVLADWIERQGSNPGGYKLSTRVYFMAMHIKKHGIAPKPFMRPAYELVAPEFYRQAMELAQEDVRKTQARSAKRKK